ncbi:MAG TPA: glycosyltransferase family 4 protein [Stellaceae bacterium]|jgi:glycosyltransferase involved in cell wall biosynthesis
MRVLVISHGHPAFSIGGAEIASHNLFQGLNHLPGCEAYYLARAAHPLKRHRHTPLMSLRQSEREAFLFCDDYEHFWVSNGATSDLAGAFRRFVEDVRPDVVHFHHVLGLGVEALFAVRKALPGVPIVVTFHEYLSICLNHGQMVKTSKNRLCSRATPAECGACFPTISPAEIFKRELFLKSHLGIADCYVSPSHFLIDRYVKWGLPAEKFRMLENGLEAFTPAPPRELPPNGRRGRFGFFGQVTEFKGLPVLLDAVGRVPDEVWGDDAALCIFGGNLESQPEAFQKRFNELVEKVGRRAKFYGAYRSDEMPNLMKQVDWVVVPSIWWENSPLVIQEAFAHGRPLIASDIGGMAEKIAHDVNGLHFRVASAEDLADRLTQALTTPGLWDRLRAAAPRPITYREAAEQHLDLYRELIARRDVPAAVDEAPKPPRRKRDPRKAKLAA